MKDRMLFRQVIESLKCLETGVLRSVDDGNIGSIMGIGAPVWTGGFIQFVNTYGPQRFVDRCNELAEQYGERFRPPQIALEKAGISSSRPPCAPTGAVFCRSAPVGAHSVRD